MTGTDGRILQMVSEMGGIESTVKALKKHSEDYEEVASSGCGLLMNICGYSDLADAALLECGGITAIVQAMRYWPDNERLQCYACTALDRLATTPNKDIHKKIIDVGGLLTLAEARSKHQNDVRVKLPASHAIVALVQEK